MNSIADWLPILVLAAVIVIFPILGLIWLRMEKQRTTALQQLATEMGFSFEQKGGKYMSDIDPTGKIELFRRGNLPAVSNVMYGKREDYDMYVFDFAYTTGSGRSRTTHRQSVAAMKLEKPELTTFSLRPESFFDKVAGKFGKVDINFENRPVFSNKYHLTAEDETAVRRLFQDSVMDFCEGQKNFKLEAIEDRLVMLHPDWRAKPEEMRSFMEASSNILSLLRRPHAAGWGDLYDFGTSTKG